MARLKDPDRRALILRVALEHFSARGFHAASIKDLAGSCEISLGSLYTYFRSKEELVNELFRHWKMQFANFVAEGTADVHGRAAHRMVWSNIARYIAEHPKAFGFLEAQLHATYLDDVSIRLENELNESLISYYQDRIQLGHTREQAQLVISATFGSYVQVFKASEAGLIKFGNATHEQLEVLAWRMASGT